MDYNKKMIDLLVKYMSQYEDMKTEYVNKGTYRDLYKQVLEYMDDIKSVKDNIVIISIILESIYGNTMGGEELINIIYSDSLINFNRFKKRLVSEYEKIIEQIGELSIKIIRNRKLFESCNRAKTSIRYGLPINKGDVFDIERVFSYFEVSGVINNKEEVLLINEIETYNRRLLSKDGNDTEKEYADRLYYELPNIIDGGFYYYEEVNVDKNKKNYLNNIADGINFHTKEEVLEYLSTYSNSSYEYTDFCYIIVRVINRLIDEMLAIRELILSKDIYIKRANRLELCKEFYVLNDIYVGVINYYEEVNNNVIIADDFDSNDLEKDNCHVEDTSKTIKNRLIFSRSSENSVKTKFMDDIKSIDYEYYFDIKELIDSYIEGRIIPKTLSSYLKGSYFELKKDNIRIVLRRCSGNVNCVLGVMIKKDNNDQKMYNMFFKRMMPLVDNEGKLDKELALSQVTYEEFSKLVMEKGRRNGRK